MKCPKCGYENKGSTSTCVQCYFDLGSDRVPVNTPIQRTTNKKTPSQLPSVTQDASLSSPLPDSNQGQSSSQSSAVPVIEQPADPVFPPTPAYPMVMDYAGFGLRFAAYFIDAVLLVFVAYIIGMLTGGTTEPTGSMSGEQNTKAMLEALNGGANGVWISNLINIIYFIGMNTAKGATLGKMALGLKIVKADGSPIGLGTAIVRYIMESILAAVTCGLMFISIATSPTKQGWHDRIAGTVVIRSR
ncbi:RDD family protein [bacterium]|nr:RDD family protein [bacterium]